MYKKELLDSLNEQGKGLIVTKRDYKIVFEDSKELALKENREYKYSNIYSIVFDGKNEVKFTYTEFPSTNTSKDHDCLKQYTDFKYKTLSLKEISELTFIE